MYRIIDKEGQDVRFEPNWAQQEMFEKAHNRNIILKARQLGSSTFWALNFLDDAIFKHNQNIGIVSYNLEHAKWLYKKVIRHALNKFSGEAARTFGIPAGHINKLVQVQGDCERGLSFGNGSTIRVDTSMRGGTLTHLLVSEFGKTCCRTPLKADEVITGSINTLPKSATCVIESSGEGMDGHFYDMCKRWEAAGDPKTPLDFRFFFFPWHKHPEYRLEQYVKPTQELEEYFNYLEKRHGLELEPEQKSWYVNMSMTQGDKMRQEYPSTSEEGFLASSEAYIHAEQIHELDKNGFITDVPYNPSLPVYAAFDIGVNDLTSIWFFQMHNTVPHFIDYYEDNNKEVDFYVQFLLQQKPYLYGGFILPHDAENRDKASAISYASQFRKLVGHTGASVIILEKSSVDLGIHNTKIMLRHCYFDASKCNKGVQHLKKYKKQWNERMGCWMPKPLHDEHSHAASAMRYACMAIERGLTKSRAKAYENHKKALSRRKLLI